MLQGNPAFWPLALAIALAPALVRLWHDRALLRFENDPTLPERLLARRRQNQGAGIVCGVLLGVGWGARGFWALPILIAADVAAAYPFRKRLFGETWSLAAFLSFTCRILIANFAFWILLATGPFYAGLGGTPNWIVPAAIAALLLAWHERFAEVVRFLLRAKTVGDPALLTRFEALARQSTAPMPRFDCMDLRGGVLVNAFALPSLRRSSVIFTDTLLARLTPDETAAICAHELAHLEYYDRRRLARFAVVNRLLIVAAGAIQPAGNVLPIVREVAWIAWPFAVLCALVWRAKDRQRNETVSDQRAVALTGNAEALAQGLIKLYTWGRVPRRLPPDYEQRATHPSLARRIRDIRAAAGVAAPLPRSIETFTASDGAARVAFEKERVRWTVGDAAEHALAYAGLRELRVQASGSAAPTLVAVDGTGRRWEMPLAPGDTARLQQALDEVDGLLAPPARAPRLSAGSTRAFAALAAMVVLATSQFAAAVAAFVAFARPAPPLLASAGVASIAAGFLQWRDGPDMLVPFAAIAVLAGGGLCVLAWVKRRDEEPRDARMPLALLATMAAISVALALSTGLAPIRLHQAARVLPSAAVLPLALATALAWAPRRILRLAAVTAALCGLTFVVAGSITFLERAGRDPLLLDAAEMRVTPVGVQPLSEQDAPAGAADVILSPGATSYMVTRDDYEDDPPSRERWAFQVGRIGGGARPVAADAAAFVDDDHVLIARFGDAGADLREVPVESPDDTLWQLHVADVTSGSLAADGNRWRVLGRAGDSSVVRVEGTVDSSDVSIQRWPADRRHWGSAVESDGALAVTMEKGYETGPLASPRYLGILPLLMGGRSHVTFRRLEPGGATEAGRSLLDATCADAAIEGTLVCAAFDGERTRLVGFAARTGRFEPMAAVRGRFTIIGQGSVRGWLTGWSEGTPMAIRLATSDAFTLPARRRAYVRAVSAAGTRLAALEYAQPRPRLRIYALP